MKRLILLSLLFASIVSAQTYDRFGNAMIASNNWAKFGGEWRSNWPSAGIVSTNWMTPATYSNIVLQVGANGVISNMTVGATPLYASDTNGLYPSSNPSNFVNATVTNGLASITFTTDLVAGITNNGFSGIVTNAQIWTVNGIITNAVSLAEGASSGGDNLGSGVATTAVQMAGFTINGNSTSGGNLTIAPTTHATKGAIIFGSADANGAKMAIVGNNTATLSRGDGANTINLRDAEIKGYIFCSSGFSGSGWAQGSRLTCTLSDTTFYSGTSVGDGSSVWKFIPGASTLVALTARGAASQSGNLQNWESSTPTVLSYVNSVGNVGVRMGATASTAYLHVAPGTTNASSAPIKMTSGPVTTTAENGAIEHDGTNFYTTALATRLKVGRIAAVNSVSPTAPNRTIEIVIDGTTYYLHAKTTND